VSNASQNPYGQPLPSINQFAEIQQPASSAPPMYPAVAATGGPRAYPSMETLAVTLNVPELMDLSQRGITTDALAKMNQQDAINSGLNKDNFFKVKQYFIQNQ
jgi:hypothetical protein